MRTIMLCTNYTNFSESRTDNGCTLFFSTLTQWATQMLCREAAVNYRLLGPCFSRDNVQRKVWHLMSISNETSIFGLPFYFCFATCVALAQRDTSCSGCIQAENCIFGRPIKCRAANMATVEKNRFQLQLYNFKFLVANLHKHTNSWIQCVTCWICTRKAAVASGNQHAFDCVSAGDHGLLSRGLISFWLLWINHFVSLRSWSKGPKNQIKWFPPSYKRHSKVRHRRTWLAQTTLTRLRVGWPLELMWDRWGTCLWLHLIIAIGQEHSPLCLLDLLLENDALFYLMTSLSEGHLLFTLWQV